MKTIATLAGLMVWSVALFAQVEQDDMYFNKKDRKELNKEEAAQEPAFARASKSVEDEYNTQSIENISSRNVNPEYISRSQSEMVSGEKEAHFIENYQHASQTQFNTFNNDLNAWNNSPIYSNTYFAPSINGWNSPYYSPYNDPFLTGYYNNPWYDPFYSSGWSVSFSSYWGNPWNYGWGRPSIGFGYNMCWGSCLPSWGFGGGYWNNFYGGGFYPSNVIIVGENYRGPVYGKRNSRSQQVANSRENVSAENNNRSYNSRTNPSISNGNGSVNSRPQSSRTNEYYTPQWRRVPQEPVLNGTDLNGTDNSNNRTYQNRTSTDVINRNSGNQQRSNSYTPSQRSSGSSTAPSRSSGSSGGSRSRSRDN